MSALTDQLAAGLPESLRLTEYGDVINVMTTGGREMTREDVDAFRAALFDAGYVEVKSWVAIQGASWLSDGVFAGVSFRIRPR